MKSILPVLQDMIADFGGIINNDINANFPQKLINKHKLKLFSFWEENIEDYINHWLSLNFKTIVFGSLIATDLSLHANQMSKYFKTILIREPFSKIFLLEPYKTTYGIRMEIIAYLNVIIEIENLISKGNVFLYPPIFLMPPQIKSKILKTVGRLCNNDIFKSLALTCPDRKFNQTDSMQYYNNNFIKIFDQKFIDLSGGLSSFTSDYIIKTMAHDVAYLIHLSSEINALPIVCLERHWQILSKLNELSENSIQSSHSFASIKSLPNWTQINKEIFNNGLKENSSITSVFKNFKLENQSINGLKVPFKSNWVLNENK